MSRAEEGEAARNKKKMAAKEKQYHEELKMELTGSKIDVEPVVAEDEGEGVADATNKRIAQEDDADMSTMLMSRKERGLIVAMQIAEERMRASVEVIAQRQRRLNDAQS